MILQTLKAGTRLTNNDYLVLVAWHIWPCASLCLSESLPFPHPQLKTYLTWGMEGVLMVKTSREIVQCNLFHITTISHKCLTF